MACTAFKLTHRAVSSRQSTPRGRARGERRRLPACAQRTPGNAPRLCSQVADLSLRSCCPRPAIVRVGRAIGEARASARLCGVTVRGGRATHRVRRDENSRSTAVAHSFAYFGYVADAGARAAFHRELPVRRAACSGNTLRLILIATLLRIAGARGGSADQLSRLTFGKSRRGRRRRRYR